MRKGKELTIEQCNFLICPVTEQEICDALKNMSDITAPGVDGYGSKLFKCTWSIIKKDIIVYVHDFFDKGRLYKVVNNTPVTNILKLPQLVWLGI